MGNRKSTTAVSKGESLILEPLIRNEGLVHIPETVFNYLSDSDLAKCRLVCHLWKTFLDGEYVLILAEKMEA